MNNFSLENTTLDNIEAEIGQKKMSDRYIVKYVQNGIPIVYTYENNKLDVSHASMEHTEVPKLSIKSPLKHIEYLYGIGNSSYMLFMRFVVFTNFMYSLITLGSLIPSIMCDNQGGTYIFPKIFNIQNYNREIKPFWMTTVIVINVCNFICGFIFYFISKIYIRKRQQKNNNSDEIIVQYDTIQNNKYVPRKTHIIRIIVSYVVYIAILCVGGIIAYYVTVSGTYIQQNANDFGFIVPIMVSIVNISIRIMSKMICKILTNFEKHSKWSRYRQHWLIKFFSFKFLNIIILYAAQYLARIDDTEKCPLSDIGTQYVVNYVLDVITTSLTGTLLPLFNFYCMRCKGNNIKRKNNEAKDSFDIVEEYLEIFYQQFTLYLGGTIVPAIYFIGLIGSILTYYFDKLRMAKLCYVKISHKTPNSLLLIMTTLISIIAFFVFPDGVYWIMSTLPQSRFKLCVFLS